MVGALHLLPSFEVCGAGGGIREQLCDHSTWLNSGVFAVNRDFADLHLRNSTLRTNCGGLQ